MTDKIKSKVVKHGCYLGCLTFFSYGPFGVGGNEVRLLYKSNIVKQLSEYVEECNFQADDGTVVTCLDVLNSRSDAQCEKFAFCPECGEEINWEVIEEELQ